jgi:outer membrane lipase/esterase
MRRAAAALACVSALLVAACGSGTIESQLQPTRLVVFGDALSDLGQRGSRYTVNDGGLNIWSQAIAASFGVNLTTAAAGGTSYAVGNARIANHPDAAGNASTPTVKEQIDTFLAGNNTIGANDLVIVDGGIGDIIAEMGRLNSGAQTSDQMIANVRQAARDLGDQARRLVQAGATHVVVVGTYDLSRSPWATATSQTDLLSQASGRFNDQLLLSMVDLGNNVLYVDAALFFNLMAVSPQNYGLTDATTPVCTAVDSGPGIGIGTGQLNSALCNTNTIIAGANYASYMFADRVYFTPAAQRQFADYAFNRIRSRF